eukprot:CAMPEP_0184447996 /NCGR_PEP_ID=MMETSP0740-20130409/4081_1 /TAXON_ID=385413 /ORGANISM="Thalassiosira miniscula, Strain CCMP1093" /LENGTH=109 /DNA_ID=CAMNT_0026817781 /DNA_START=181 /DNA_END=508 /DNA_ORIENTATION=+
MTTNPHIRYCVARGPATQDMIMNHIGSERFPSTSLMSHAIRFAQMEQVAAFYNDHYPLTLMIDIFKESVSFLSTSTVPNSKFQPFHTNQKLNMTPNNSPLNTIQNALRN